jgi:adenylate cyclase
MSDASGFFNELKRRNVFRVAGAYAVVAWLLIEVSDTIFPRIGLPEWSVTLVIALVALGFPVALLLSWAYELTPAGMKRTEEVPAESSGTRFGGRKLDFVIIGVLVVALGWFAWDRFVTGGVATAEAGEASIAVLPFVNMSSDEETDYFADGVSEEILNLLARIEGLRVAGRTSAFKFKGHDEDLRIIGDQLGVTHILEGSVRRSGNQVRVTAQLILVENGFHLWSDAWDRELTDIFAVQDEIGRSVADALSIRLGAANFSLPRGTESVQAHDLALQARELLAARGAPNLVRAAELFGAAVERDPDYSEAWSGRARALSLIWNYDPTSDARTQASLAEEAAQQALSANPENAEALSVLAYLDDVVHWEWERAQQRLLRAIALAPNDAEIANFAGDHFAARLDVENMLAWERKAIELDPLKAVNHSDLGWRLVSIRRCDEAVIQADRALALDPDFLMGHDLRVVALACLGRLDEARAAAQPIRNTGEQAYADFMDAVIAEIGGAAGSEFEGHDLRMREHAEAGRSAYWPAAVTADLAGDPEAAATLLRRSFDAGEAWVVNEVWRRLPEDWSDHPDVQAALDRPGLRELFEIRRRNLAAWRDQEGVRP